MRTGWRASVSVSAAERQSEKAGSRALRSVQQRPIADCGGMEQQRCCGGELLWRRDAVVERCCGGEMRWRREAVAELLWRRCGGGEMLWRRDAVAER